jgi:cytochrome c55X
MRLLVKPMILALFCGSTAAALAEPAAARQQALVRLVRQDCGSCHGMTLQGGLGSALLPDNLRDKAPESLVATIMGGRPGTPMPPWKQFVVESEAVWIVEQLMTKFPE